MTPIQKFAKNWKMPIKKAYKLRSLANSAGVAGVKICNGDPHFLNPNKEDKNKNCQLWDKELDKITEEIAQLVAPYGFKVEYNGLHPSLSRENGETVFIPD